MTIQVCRICLAHDTRMCTIAYTPLLIFYQNITNKPFNIEGEKPSLVCYICLHLLEKCHRFTECAIKADEVQQQMLKNGIQITEQCVSMILNPFTVLKTTPVTNLNVARGRWNVSADEISKVKCENHMDLLDVDSTDDIQQGIAVSAIPEEINTPMNFEIKKETVLDIAETEGDLLCSNEITQFDLHHSSDLDDDEPMESIKLEDDGGTIKRLSDIATNAEFREITLTREEQIQLMLEKMKSPKYLRMRHKCELCCKGFANLRTFTAHKKKHDKRSGAFECSICRIRFRSGGLARAHASKCHASTNYACRECSHRAQTVAQARKHYTLEHSACAKPQLAYLFGAPEPKKRQLDRTTKSPARLEVPSLPTEDVIAADNEKDETQTKGGPGQVKLTKENLKNATNNETKTKSIKDVKAKQSKKRIKRTIALKRKKTSKNKCDQTSTKVSVHIKKLFNPKKPLQNRNKTTKKLFLCDYCGKKFKSKYILKRHISIHSQKREKPFSCKYCEKTYSRKEYLKYHTRLHTGEELFKCKYCWRVFTQERGYIKHLKTHSDDRPFQCDICGNKFVEKYDLLVHIRKHNSGKPFSCEFCEKSYKFKNNLKRHIMAHTGEKPFICNYCNRNFATKSHLRRHVQLHEKPFACHYCDKKYTLKDRFNSHVRKHTGEKAFTCSFCKRQFMKKSELLTHLVTHSEERPFACNICNKSFSLKKALNLHVRTHTEEKPFICDYCSRSFTMKGNLVGHIKIHMGIKPYQCKFCKKKFTQNSCLTKHLRMHTGEEIKCNFCDYKTVHRQYLRNHIKKHTGEQFSCDHCDRKFTRKTGFIEHLRVHTGEKPFRCEYCKKKFTSKGMLSKHVRMCELSE